MTGYSLKAIADKFRNGIYQKSEVDSALSLKVNNTDVVGAIGNINSPLLDMPLKNSLAMKAGVGSATFTRASTATYIDRYGVLKTAAVDEPRFEKEGYLNEGSSANLLLYSEQFDNAAWVKEASTITANTTDTLDPYGTNVADKIMETAVSQSHAVYTGASYNFTAGATYTQSVFLKPNGRSIFRITTWSSTVFTTPRSILVNLSTKTISVNEGAVLNYKLDTLPNGWFRVQFSYTADATGTTFGAMVRPRLDDGATENYLGDTTKGFFIMGAQLEALPFATSYIPTTGATVTRSADVLNVTAANNIGYFMDNWTISFDVVIMGVRPSINGTILYLSGLSNTYMLNICDYGNGNVVLCYVNSSQYPTANPTVVYKNKNRITFVLNNGVLYGYLNGVSVGIGATVNTTPVTIKVPTSIVIGDTTGNSSYKKLSNIRIYDKALTAQEVALA